MENKYFIPEISDFHNGYEYERNDGGEWYSVTCDLYDARDIKTLLNKKVLDTFPEGKSPLDSDTYSAHYKATGIDRIRVLHLTKEQIEAEGWEEMNAPIISIGHGFLYIPFLKNNCRLDYNYTTNILNIKKDDVTNLYYGECKDINTFRKIIKLLGI